MDTGQEIATERELMESMSAECYEAAFQRHARPVLSTTLASLSIERSVHCWDLLLLSSQG